jgi:glutamate/tyrosine decarboxylase-like PLP-dependent enzyme
LHYAVRTGHRQFFNQLYGGFSLAGFAGDVVTALTNTSMYTYEVAPVATLMELALIDRMNGHLGFRGGEGIFCSGGSHANTIAVICARDRVFPHVRSAGWRGEERPVFFVSREAHYSFRHAANQLGIGIDNLVAVECDSRGRMTPEPLEREIAQSLEAGRTPFMVAATAGTTVLGAFDPLPEIAEICRRQNLWFHVDGAWGAPVILSDRHRHLLAGVEKADSFTWDAHKLMGASLTCSAFLTRHRGLLRRVCSLQGEETDYLYHETEDSAWDLGARSFQCGRRVDALKLWLMWKHHGDSGFAAIVDRFFDLARVAGERIERHPRLELMAPVQFLNVCFRYLPPRGTDPDPLNLELRERLRRSGRAFLNYSRLHGELALRMILTNPELTEEGLALCLDRVVAAGDRLTAERGVGRGP